MKSYLFRILTLAAILSAIVASSVCLGAPRKSKAPQGPDPAACAKYFAAFKEALVGGVPHTEWGNGQMSADLKAIEDEILQFLKLSPEYRRQHLQEFTKRWHASPEDTENLMMYYSNHAYKDPSFAASREDVHERILLLSYELFENAGPASVASRRAYYEKAVGKKTVEEISKDLGMPQGQVYEELSQLGIHLAEKNAPNLGKGWQRLINYEGRKWSEDELITKWTREAESPAEIAERLNRLTMVSDDSPFYRTDLAVRSRIWTPLGMALKTRFSRSEIFDPAYGYLKRNGRMVSATIVRFILRNPNKDLAWYARYLDVSEAEVKEFIFNNSIGYKEGKLIFRESVKSRALQSLFAEQKEVVDDAIKWIQRTGQVPRDADFGLSGKGKIPHAYARATSEVFPSAEDFWIAVYEEARTRNPPIYVDLWDVNVVQASKRWAAVLKAGVFASKEKEKTELYDKILDWIKTHGELPKSDQYSKEFNIDYQRVVGLGPYGENGAKGHRQLHASLEELLTNLYNKSVERGHPIDLWLDAHVQDTSQKWRDLIRNTPWPSKKKELDELYDRILVWSRKNGDRVPTEDDLRALKVEPQRWYGMGKWAAGGEREMRQLHSGAEESLLALYERSKAQGHPIDLWTSRIAGSQKFKDLLLHGRWPSKEKAREKAMDWTLAWAKDHSGKLPTKAAYKKSELNFDQVLAWDPYAPGKKQEHLRLFESREDFLTKVYERSKLEGQEVDLSSVDIKNPSAEWKALVDEQKRRLKRN